MAKPLPGLDVPVINSTGQMNQSWYEFYQSLFALLNTTAGTLAALPAHDVTKSDVTRTINAQTGTTYTFVITDADELCTFSNGSPVTATVPPNSSVAFPIGTQIDLAQTGAGKTTLAQGAGVTINSFSSNKALGGQYSGATLVKTATDTWLLVGSLIA
jgi:hypothetical protein